MKHIWLILILLLYQTVSAQDIVRIGDKSELGSDYYQAVTDYMEHQTDRIALNSIIEVNGIVHPRDTYGYIEYTNTEGLNKRCHWVHLGGVICVSKKDYEDILELPDTSNVCIAICLQSPAVGDWGGSWDMVMVKGIFEVSQLITTHSNMISPCFHFIITSIGTNLFKIQFSSWKVQTYYYTTGSTPMTLSQRKQLDRKELKIYKYANMLHFERKLW